MLEEGIGFPGTGIMDGCEPPMWVLGSKRGSFGKAAIVINHWAISLLESCLSKLPSMMKSSGVISTQL